MSLVVRVVVMMRTGIGGWLCLFAAHGHKPGYSNNSNNKNYIKRDFTGSNALCFTGCMCWHCEEQQYQHHRKARGRDAARFLFPGFGMHVFHGIRVLVVYD